MASVAQFDLFHLLVVFASCFSCFCKFSSNSGYHKAFGQMKALLGLDCKQHIKILSCPCPVLPRRFDRRPDVDSFCEAIYPFCPTGDRDGRIPEVRNSDVISVYRLQTPVWEFKYGSLLGKMVRW